MPDPLITIAEAARQVGVHTSTLMRQVRQGLIRSHKHPDYKLPRVRLSEVIEDRANNVDPPRGPQQATATPDDVGQQSLIRARGVKETYIARLRKLEFEYKSGELIQRSVVEKTAFNVGRQIRDSLQALPAQIAPIIAAEFGIDSVKLAVSLERQFIEYLARQAKQPEVTFRP